MEQQNHDYNALVTTAGRDGTRYSMASPSISERARFSPRDHYDAPEVVADPPRDRYAGYSDKTYVPSTADGARTYWEPPRDSGKIVASPHETIITDYSGKESIATRQDPVPPNYQDIGSEYQHGPAQPFKPETSWKRYRLWIILGIVLAVIAIVVGSVAGVVVSRRSST
jgi:hypothetical protein